MNGDQVGMTDAELVLTALDLRGTAAQIDLGGGKLRLEAAALTRCQPANETWVLSARRIQFDEGAVFATARHARLTLGGVPIFYSPRVRFPVSGQRTSGLLLPNLAYGGEDASM